MILSRPVKSLAIFMGVFVRFSSASVKKAFARPVTSASFLPSWPRGSVAKPGPAKHSSSTCFFDGFQHFGMLVTNA